MGSKNLMMRGYTSLDEGHRCDRGEIRNNTNASLHMFSALANILHLLVMEATPLMTFLQVLVVVKLIFSLVLMELGYFYPKLPARLRKMLGCPIQIGVMCMGMVGWCGVTLYISVSLPTASHIGSLVSTFDFFTWWYLLAKVIDIDCAMCSSFSLVGVC
ncbi:hypothetical protein DSO57_1028406 [Entomophthora muscae]|uniref:Uncharacterized protein n=1 Tax=Entomophthora muscae TaxID=34485 RepID=A0ACC2UAH2_9FUNG|nr:hypothetical protein DSO57_1028406 [Entomophthora muscae]